VEWIAGLRGASFMAGGDSELFGGVGLGVSDGELGASNAAAQCRI
jgi:hypothetical protein